MILKSLLCSSRLHLFTQKYSIQIILLNITVQFKINIFHFNISKNVIYFWGNKTKYPAAITLYSLQSHMILQKLL